MVKKRKEEKNPKRTKQLYIQNDVDSITLSSVSCFYKKMQNSLDHTRNYDFSRIFFSVLPHFNYINTIHLISGTPPPSLRRRSSTDTSGEVINYGENEISWDASTGFGGQSQPQTYSAAEGHFFSLVTKLVFDLSKKSYASFWCN